MLGVKGPGFISEGSPGSPGLLDFGWDFQLEVNWKSHKNFFLGIYPFDQNFFCKIVKIQRKESKFNQKFTKMTMKC